MPKLSEMPEEVTLIPFKLQITHTIVTKEMRHLNSLQIWALVT